ncbi:hypothetical protein GPROT2_00464 [Gammaproteobacteria bacterium]|nr:hypothetical protein GPROT2_00464 [Gammaproteobacteria bacterium]
MLTVNFFDIGSLDCSEAIALFDSPLTLPETLADEVRVMARRARYGRGSTYHPGWTSRFHWRLSRRPRFIPASLLGGTIAVNVFLIDPQLELTRVRRLQALTEGLPNLAIFPLRAAVDAENGFSFRRLYLTRSGDPLGSSLFPGKHNVDPRSFHQVPCIGITDIFRSIEAACSLRNGACNILRINAEGAEYGIMKALSAAGYLGAIGLFMGAGHDLRKIDAALYEEYLRFLAQHEITFIEFKASDRAKTLRAACSVEQHVRQAIDRMGDTGQGMATA